MPLSDYYKLPHYVRHNHRRHEHLATLGLPLPGRKVLEVGAGIGDHTGFLVDRGCRVTSTEARPDMLAELRERYPQVRTLVWDVEQSPPRELEPHDIVYAYGLLYHTSKPAQALAHFARLCESFMVLETCVSFGDDLDVHLVQENLDDPTQALRGTGCRPTRPWVMRELRRHFAHVYVTRTQPWHEEFPLDWRHPERHPAPMLTRQVFVASRAPMSEERLSPELVDVHARF